MQRSYRRLIAGLVFFQVAHLLGVLSMLAWLLPGLDPALELSARHAYVHANVWLWRFGWLPWQLCAASDLWVTFALIAWTRRDPWSLLAAGLLAIAIVPEQLAEAYLVSGFTALPAGALWAERLRQCMWWTGTWAAFGYMLMTASWLLAVRERSAGWLWFELSVLVAFAVSAAANHFAWAEHENVAAFQFASAFNGFGFLGLFAIGFRIATLAGQQQLGTAPLTGGGWLDELARSTGLRDVLRPLQAWLPFPRLVSDVRDVLYLNWLVSADALQALLPGSLRIKRYDDRALLTVLVFRHGNFGPARLGPLRKLLGSPIQCNVRAYLETPPFHVAFVANSLDQSLYFVGSRLACDGLPTQRSRPAQHALRDQEIATDIQPAPGWTFGLRARAAIGGERGLPDDFAQIFGDWQSALNYIVPQNAALRELPSIGALCVTEIVVDVPKGSEQPASVVSCELTQPLAAVVAQREPFAFLLPRVQFAVLGERLGTTARTELG